MKRVLAALDNSLACTPVLAAARALATLLDARVEALHVRTNGDRTARNAAEAAGIPLRTASGPVVVIPPEARVPQEFRRVLAPLEASLSASLAPQTILELAREATIEAVALHVYDEDSLPPFTDQPQHEQAAWAQEFLARYCPSGLGRVQLETRVGRGDALVPLVADECNCDLVALGWSQELAPGRASVVRGTLERSRLPVLLVPVRLLSRPSAAGESPLPERAPATRRRR